MMDDIKITVNAWLEDYSFLWLEYLPQLVLYFNKKSWLEEYLE